MQKSSAEKFHGGPPRSCFAAPAYQGVEPTARAIPGRALTALRTSGARSTRQIAGGSKGNRTQAPPPRPWTVASCQSASVRLPQTVDIIYKMKSVAGAFLAAVQ